MGCSLSLWPADVTLTLITIHTFSWGFNAVISTLGADSCFLSRYVDCLAMRVYSHPHMV